MNWQFAKCEGYDANRLLRELEIFFPPVPVKSLVEQLGVHIHFVNEQKWKGAARSDHQRADIWVDTSSAGQAEEQRWILAHELGHLLLHPLGSEFRDISFKGTTYEQEANSFAANLLMPDWMLTKAFPRAGSNVQLLASVFYVSVEAMHARLDNYLSQASGFRKIASH